MKFRHLAPVSLLVLGTLGGAACKEQQVMYSEAEPAEATEPAAAPGGGTTAALPAGHPPLTPSMDALPPGHPPLTSTGATTAMRPEAPSPDRATLPEGTSVVPVEFVGLSFPLPETWTSRRPASSMRLAEFGIPAAEEGAAGADLVMFHFGANQGGDAISNVQRWVGQMELEPDTVPVVYQQKRGDLTVTEVVCYGTQKPSGMGTGPSTPVPGSGLHGLIIEGGPQGSLFLKITGDATTIQTLDPAVATLVAGLEVASE